MEGSIYLKVYHLKRLRRKSNHINIIIQLLLLHIARCAVQKNQDLLIDAFNEIISQKHNVILLIIGSGFDSEKGNELKRRAHNGIYF